jgi:hypothetical protein
MIDHGLPWDWVKPINYQNAKEKMKKKSNDTLNKMAMYKLTELSRISWHLLAYVREPVEF